MGINNKHALVIIFSSIIIAAVMVSTLVGYHLYIEWREDRDSAAYNNAIYKLTADMFKKDVGLSNLRVAIGGKEMFTGMPIIEGSLKNNSSKIVTSIMLEVQFSRPDGSVVYREWFYPLGAVRPAPIRAKRTKNVLMPGEGISFRHLLRNCPSEVASLISEKTGFAKGDREPRIKTEYSIVGMSVL